VKTAGQQAYGAPKKAEAPYIAKARATYPAAKKRYLAGLPPSINLRFASG
jgi:hypothetical protein